MFIKVKNHLDNDVYLNINHIRAIYCIPENQHHRETYYSIYYGDAEDNYITILEDEFNKIKNSLGFCDLNVQKENKK